MSNAHSNEHLLSYFLINYFLIANNKKFVLSYDFYRKMQF